MTNRTLARRSLVTTLTTAGSLLAAQAVQACEGCKQSVGMGDGAGGKVAVNAVGLGYGLSILFLLALVTSVLVGLGWMMYRNCQIIAARQRAMLAEEEAGDFGGSLSAGGLA